MHEMLEFARELSREAGAIILPLWKNVAIEHKADGSEVTDADRGAEQLMRHRIAERFPGHAILGEEFGGEQVRDAEHLWLLDPIDGTASFAIGLPTFGTLIGYLHRGEPTVGVIGAHALGETVFASTGQGCWFQRDGAEARRVRTSAISDPSQALMIATDPTDQILRLRPHARRFRWSGDCINYALLCQGRIDVALDPRMHPWDIAALAPCVREAGGVLTGLDGNPDVVWQPNLLASATPRLHEQVLRILNG